MTAAASSELYGFGVTDDMTSTTGRASTVGFLTSTFATGSAGVCSGTVVARNKVLFAAHCVCGPNKSLAQLQTIGFMLPQNGGITIAGNLGSVVVSPAAALPCAWQVTPLHAGDLAVVTLSADVPAAFVE